MAGDFGDSGNRHSGDRLYQVCSKKQADSAAFEGEISTEASLGPFKEQTEEEAQKEESGAVQEQAQADTAVPETEQKEEEAGEPAAISEPVPAMARSAVPESGRAATDSQADSPCEGGLYRQRLNDLDAQIQKMQEQERDPNVYSIKTSAETEVKMWDRELNAVYNALWESSLRRRRRNLQRSRRSGS